MTDCDVRICEAMGEAPSYIGREGGLAQSAAATGDVLSIFQKLLPGSVVIEAQPQRDMPVSA